MNRSEAPYDVAVVGGGLHGTAVARDAARRGLRVVLFEAGDLAATPGGLADKVVHAGLNDFVRLHWGRVRERVRERDTLLRIAPHLVRALPVLALHADRAPWSGPRTSFGLLGVDLLAGGRRLERPRRLDRSRAVELEPVLDVDGLTGAHRFVDAEIDDARVCIENARDAALHGAQILSRHRVVGLRIDDGTVHGVDVEDVVLGARRAVEARVVVDAAGAETGALAAHQTLTRAPRIDRVASTHLVLPPLTRGHALWIADDEGRRLQAIPWKGRTLVGDAPRPARDEDPTDRPPDATIDSILRTLNRRLAGPDLERGQVLRAFTTVRAARAVDSGSGRLPQDAEMREDAPGLLGILGAGSATFRAVADRVVDAVERRVHGQATASTTAESALPGGDALDMNDYFQVAEDVLIERYPGLDVAILRYLIGTYGTRHAEILQRFDDDPESVRRIEPDLPFTWAEVEHAVDREFARSVDDLVHRRTYRGALGGVDETVRARWRDALEHASRRRGVEALD